MRRPLRSFEEKVAATIRNPARGTAAGARVPSALPVPRQRIPRLIAGGSATSAYILRPDTITDYDDQPVSYQGGGGQSTLRDQSDSTFLRLFYDLSVGGGAADFFGTPVATFEAATLPAEPTAATLTVRARSLDNTGGNAIGFTLAGDIIPGGTYSPYFTDSTEVDDTAPWVPGGSWVDYAYSWVTDPGHPLYYLLVPSVAQVAAGGIQLLVTPTITTGADMQLDIADVWLTLA